VVTVEKETCADLMRNFIISALHQVLLGLHEGNMRWAENIVRMRNLCTSLFDEREEKEEISCRYSWVGGGVKKIISLSLDMMPCNFVDMYQVFGRTFCLRLQGRGANPSGTFIQITPRLTRENSITFAFTAVRS
jgi:hypothetical protein